MKTYYYFERKLKIQLSDIFQDMETEIIEKKFPYMIKPSIVKWDKGDKIFTLDLIYQALEERSVYSAVFAMQRKINKLYPGCIIKVTTIEHSQSTISAWFAFSLNAIEGKNVHTMFAFPLEGNFLLGSFHCAENNQHEIFTMTQQFLRDIILLKEKGFFYEEK